MWLCTAAAISYHLGWLPPRGSTVTVPRSALTQYSAKKIAKAKACAEKFDINWVIVEDKQGERQ